MRLPTDLVIDTERLTLRRFRADDFDEYAAICADARVMEGLGRDAMSRGEAWRHLAFIVGHWELLGFGMFAVEEKSTRRMIGRIGFLQPDDWPDFELGWTLASDTWGRGYATEGAAAAMRYAFEVMGRTHLISLIRPENTPSAAVARRLGEKITGHTRILTFDVDIWSITREDWQARNV